MTDLVQTFRRINRRRFVTDEDLGQWDVRVFTTEDESTYIHNPLDPKPKRLGGGAYWR